MRDWGTTGTCRAKKGLLFLHECGEPAVAECHLCARPVCMAHRTLDSVGVICPECYAQQERDSRDNEIDDQGPGWRDRYYRRHGYTPMSGDFSDDDYDAVEDETEPETTKAAVSASEPGTGTARPNGPADDLDHYMES